MEERFAPASRPEGRAVGCQRWRDLAFVHWEVDPDALARLIPPGLEVDLHDGRAYLGIVPFAMRDIRPSWMPQGLGLNFLETNVRSYVRHRGQPGVYFFSLDASSWLAVQIARAQWGLPYHRAEMSLESSGSERTADSRRLGPSSASLHLCYRIGEALEPSQPGSLEHFLIERYLLFADRRGGIIRGQVHHPPYSVQAAELIDIDETLSAAAGFEVSGPPAAIHYASGVDVEVFAPRRL